MKRKAWADGVGILIFCLLICSKIATAGDLVINEFLASNKWGAKDGFDENSDWLELYNPSNNTVNLGQFYLTDKIKVKKWQFPQIQLKPSEFLLVWASGKSRAIPKPDWPFLIEFESGGAKDGKIGVIFVNGSNKSPNRRGINVVSIAPDGVQVWGKNFDTWLSFDQSDSLVAFVNSQPAGAIVAFVIKDEGSKCLSAAARAALQQLGSESIQNLGYHDSWGMIAVKGAGVVYECYREVYHGPAKRSSADVPELHANFKLDREGELIAVLDRNGQVVDQVRFQMQTPDISMGRYPDGKADWFLFSAPTPGAANISPPMRGILAAPLISPPEGIYQGSLSIRFDSHNMVGDIFYTLDGSEPDENSIKFDGRPIPIDTTTVIRACVLASQYVRSKTVTRSYILGVEPNLDVFSIVTDPMNLWDPKLGIYVVGLDSLNPNYLLGGDTWERPANFSFISLHNKSNFNLNGGLRIHGGFSRHFPKKSFRAYFSNPYDNNNIQQELFSEININWFNNIVLQSSGNDCVADFREGHSNAWSLLRDNIMIKLYSLIGGEIVGKLSVILYLNGKNWGIYTASERIDEDFLKNHFGLEEGDLVKNNNEIIVGDINNWLEALAHFKNFDLSIESNYLAACSLIDIVNFTNYWIVNIFGGNRDWPYANIYCYRDSKIQSHWHWLMWDADYTFGSPIIYGVQANTLEYVLTDEPHNVIFKSLVKNDSYRHYFCNRFADILNHIFTETRVHAIIDSLASGLDQDIHFETDKWGGSKTQWLANVDSIKSFVSHRGRYIRQFIQQDLAAGTGVILRIDNPNPKGGQVKVNSIILAEYPWQGEYFSAIPVILQALPAPGYHFKGWGHPDLRADSISVMIADKLSLIAVFEKPETLAVVINEINYNSAPDFDPDDWIELYNPNPFSVNLNGYRLQNEMDAHGFEIDENVAIKAEGYLVLCQDALKFKTAFPDVDSFLGDFFDLGNTGDLIYLSNARDSLIDQVHYENKFPWPDLPDGQGPTLELLYHGLDNSLPASWRASTGYGTPGGNNSVIRMKEKLPERLVPSCFCLRQNYPNPFNDQTMISFDIPVADKIKIEIYNLYGQKIETIVDTIVEPGKYSVSWQPENHGSGVYFIRMVASEYSKTLKTILLK